MRRKPQRASVIECLMGCTMYNNSSCARCFAAPRPVPSRSIPSSPPSGWPHVRSRSTGFLIPLPVRDCIARDSGFQFPAAAGDDFSALSSQPLSSPLPSAALQRAGRVARVESSADYWAVEYLDAPCASRVASLRRNWRERGSRVPSAPR